MDKQNEGYELVIASAPKSKQPRKISAIDDSRTWLQSMRRSHLEGKVETLKIHREIFRSLEHDANYAASAKILLDDIVRLEAEISKELERSADWWAGKI